MTRAGVFNLVRLNEIAFEILSPCARTSAKHFRERDSIDYRHHLYELNADYQREPLHRIQMGLFRPPEALIAVGALFLFWCKLNNNE